MDWRIKGTIQRALGRLPGAERVHYALQRRAGGLRDVAHECDVKVDDLRLMIAHLREAGVVLPQARLLEIGSGWYPTFPFGLHLLGVAEVHTFDLHRHLKPELVTMLTARLEHHLPLLASLGEVPLAEVTARYAAMRVAVARDPSNLEAATGGVVRYHAPADASATALPAGTIDVVFSNSVLEHVPPPAIATIFVEAARVLAPTGLMFHSVNCGDHYAYADRTITQLNYLQYSAAAWARWDNAFLYQNRLRAIDFLELVRAAGFEITLDTSRPHPERLAELATVEVHPEFARYDRAQLAITSIDFIARPRRV